MSELLGIPPSLWTSSGWGALGIFMILTITSFAAGKVLTGKQHDTRIEDLKEFFQGRLADKDAIIADKSETNKFLMETVEVLEGNLAEMVRANETSEHVIKAIQEAMQMSSEGRS